MTSFKDLLSQRLRKLFDEKDIVKAHFAKKIDMKIFRGGLEVITLLTRKL